MRSVLQQRISKIKQLKKDQCWYITKQTLNFTELCYAAKIVELYSQRADQNSKYSEFFSEQSRELGIRNNYRMTNNCLYAGLCKKNGASYDSYAVTPAFEEIDAICQGDFSQVHLYQEQMINQIEQLFISAQYDSESTGLRNNIRLHPAFFLYKVLISLKDLGHQPSISLAHFKLFVGSAETYQDWFSTVALIIESKEPYGSEFQHALDESYQSFEDIEQLEPGITDGNRFNKFFDNLPYLHVNKSTISLVAEHESLIREKLLKYELAIQGIAPQALEQLSLTSIYLPNQHVVDKTHAKNDAKQSSSVTHGDNKIYYGPPGTGKSQQLKNDIKSLNLAAENIETVTFHPEFDYQSFVGSYKPITDVNRDGIEEIHYKFVPQSFIRLYVQAWLNPTQAFVLQIEEINRGNCAEIFGDIFQLLDRDPEYSISPSHELLGYLKAQFNDIDDARNGIKSGKLILPSNLFIWATMNTSDQSLFPMDSAFKRRWEWQYIPIKYQCDKSNFIIRLANNSEYQWLAFLKQINQKIFETTQSADKQLGNWFINANKHGKQGIIDENQFINKVIFYLFNDVFQDELDTIFVDNTGVQVSYDDYFDSKKSTSLLVELFKSIGLPSQAIIANEAGKLDENMNESE